MILFLRFLGSGEDGGNKVFSAALCLIERVCQFSVNLYTWLEDLQLEFTVDRPPVILTTFQHIL